MIAWSIQAALRSNIFDRIIVSTDSEEIRRISLNCGAEVPFMRPPELSGDWVHTAPVVSHAIKQCKENGIQATHVCCIYATAPFLLPDYLEEGFRLLRTGKWEKVLAATSFAYPIQRSFQIRDDESLEMFYPDNIDKRSQDLPQAWHDAGQFYWARPAIWHVPQKPFGHTCTVVKIPRWRAIDIDTQEDWEMAEGMFRAMFSNR